ncbi:PilN domain-containing protein [Aquisalimonas lutea]|uniref:PilN domain-containing protein n=1 Tax=Aquisalimonas lutea TaxID=1327750 RepID=UPI0025B602E0|nr:PilN domain-containing protein [Aquisalimonas lutea]MDN3516899.1 PilN domain-containing protein [Aquisalimonas lutea]
MTRINLLPWREELKKQRTVEFYVILVIAVALGAGVWYAGRWHITGLVDYHEHRNSILEEEISRLERQIEEIEKLETVREQLLARMNIIEELQAGRPQIVHLFEEIATTIPEGVYLEELEQNGDSLSLAGVAESNARISNYMERLDGSEWLTDPDLEVIEVQDRESGRLSDFSLSVQQTDPSQGPDDGEDTE